MDESIVVALITGVLAVFGSYVGNVAISRKKAREDALKDVERETRQAARLERLEKKVDEHNEWGRKIGDMKVAIEGIQKDIEWLKKNGVK